MGRGGGGGGGGMGDQCEPTLWIIQKSNKSNHNNTEKLYMHVYTHYKARNVLCFILFFIQRSISESFVELCFLCSEAGKWIAWLYLSWDSIPKGCAWKWEASFEKIHSNFGQCYESRSGASFEILIVNSILYICTISDVKSLMTINCCSTTGFGSWASPVHIVPPAPLWLEMSSGVWLSQIRWWHPVIKGSSCRSISLVNWLYM